MKGQMYYLNDEERAIAINLAMKLECGLIEPKKVLDTFKIDSEVAEAIIKFWYEFNPMTRRALNLVVYERCRLHIKKCMQIKCTDYPEMEN